MSTQMRVAQEEAGWLVLNGDRPVAINGEVHRDDRGALVSDIEEKGLFVWSDGSISKQAEPVDDSPMVFAEPELPVEDPDSGNVDGGAPPTEDPPTDPGADPEDPDPTPTVPKKPDSEPKPKKSRKTAKAEGDAPKRREKKAPDAPRFTEEQKKARAEYAKKYRASMTDEQKEKARERARERQKKWRENHPDKAAEFAKRSSERRKERYNEDPEFRQEYREKQRSYVKTKTS